MLSDPMNSTICCFVVTDANDVAFVVVVCLLAAAAAAGGGDSQ